MSFENKPLVAVAGSLSKQGRSVAQSLLQSGRYRVRALTGRTGSPEALRLAEQGAELVQVPLALNHGQDLVNAFKGAEMAFLMTPGVVPPAGYEFAIGKELADACVEADVGHVVFSSLENVDSITGGKKFAPHFTDKARVEAYIRELPIRSSFIQLAFFYTNLLEYYVPRKDGDALVFPVYLPEPFQAPFVDPLTATGPAVLEILDHPDAYAGHTLPVIGDVLSPAEMIETFTRVTGRKAVLRLRLSLQGTDQPLSRVCGERGARPRGHRDGGICGRARLFRKDRDLEWSRRINPASLSWEQFLRTTNWNGDRKAFGIA